MVENLPTERTRGNSRTLRVILLVIVILMIAMGAVIAATTATTGSSGKVPKNIALVEDQVEYMSFYLPGLASVAANGGRVDPFYTCEALLAVLEVGIRYQLYIVDHTLKGSGLQGPACTAAILRLHPDAIVLGNSADATTKQEFLDNGASSFTSKGAVAKLKNIAAQLLGN